MTLALWEGIGCLPLIPVPFSQQVYNPADGSCIAEVARVGADVTTEAIQAAKKVKESWANTASTERSALLKRWHELIRQSIDDLATIVTMEAGKPLNDSKGEINAGLASIEWMAEECTRIRGEVLDSWSSDKQMLIIQQPVGIVGAITPWNFPSNMIMRKVAPALAAGCPVVLKPSELTPLSAIALFELAHQAGFPAGVVNLVFGDYHEIGQTMLNCKDVRHITFTVSTSVGKYLAQEAGKTIKHVSMELGGNAPFIVFDDADLDLAAKHAAGSALRNAGQACSRANRLLVQEGIYDEFVSAVTKHVGSVQVGNGLDPSTSMGPLITQDALEKVEKLIADALSKGGELTTGGRRPESQMLDAGNFLQPTVIKNADHHMSCCAEESFGPLIPIVKFKTEAEALELANSTEYGLSAYCFTRDISRTWRMAKRIESGIVSVNDIAFHHPAAPFGGVKQSGIGREQGREGLKDFLEVKHVTMGMAP